MQPHPQQVRAVGAILAWLDPRVTASTHPRTMGLPNFLSQANYRRVFFFFLLS